MFKRIILALTFAAALGVAGLGMSRTADAWGGCHRGGYGGYYGGYAPYYGGYSAFYSPYGYRASYYPRYGAYYGGYYPAYYRRGGVSFSIGF